MHDQRGLGEASAARRASIPDTRKSIHRAAAWVCPMHPEIVRDQPGTCPICGMALEPRAGTPEESSPELRDMSRRFWLAVGLFLAIAIFFLWEEHRAHILGAVPYVLLLLCPIIHLFMHRGHGSHGGDRAGRAGHAHRHEEGEAP